MRRCILLLAALLSLAPLSAQRKKEDSKPAAPEAPKDPLNSGLAAGLKFRSLGPAITSGRIGDLAVNPQNPAEYYVAAASGGVWKTVNGGATFEPVFDGQGSYSIGCITLDPSNPHVVWVGTGENNAQRSVAYGDGVYKSLDGGKSWKNMGLKASEHIGKIIVDPRNPEVVFVAAQGPLWSPGGDRGLYKTADGGKTWRKVLEISENTGVNEVHFDPRDPDVMYASAWQRRRHVWTFISGGPESALYKSTDGGETWEKSQSGLPGGDLGRIGLAVSPLNPDLVYAIVEASGDKGGFYRSSDRGASWERRSGVFTSGNYYAEIFCDRFDEDRVYIMDTYARVTDDGGATVKPLGEKSKHVDNHAFWQDPAHPDHYLMGCDGGLYETWDAAKTWIYKPNLPITQFYKVATDNALPFYNVYGGTQDNFSMGGPSRTTNMAGIPNSDWIMTLGGDGFESQIDPTDPNIVYAQYQYGNLYRFDKKSGERIYIQPQPGKGEEAYRWNWDAPLLISPHSHTRLYFAANKLFRSDDRGNSWKAVSGDLSRQLDRNQLPVMGKVWGMDAVAKNQSTSIYGNIVALSESPKQEGLLYVGTDDGLVQISADGGGSWRKIESMPGVPERTYVNALLASIHDAGTVYAAFNNHKNGDFKPYLLRSRDGGSTWASIAGNLPERGSVYSIAEDHVNPDLLFAGTEFGVFFTVDGGQKWVQLKGGLPVIAIRDLEIQRRESDLVLASFGRGFYILDDYSPLRSLSPALLEKEAHIFPIKDALAYIPATPLGTRGKGFQGESYYAAENPPLGAVFTYYLKEDLKTRKELRQEAEKKLAEKGEPIPYPSFEEMRAEDDEEAPYLLFTVTDAGGQVVSRIKAPAKAGLKRAVWSFRLPSSSPIRLREEALDIFADPDQGILALPGSYRVSLAKVIGGQATEIVGPQEFKIVPLENSSLPAPDRAAVFAFSQELRALWRDATAANARHGELENRLRHVKAAVQATPQAPLSLLPELARMEQRLRDLSRQLNGDASLARREFPVPPSVSDRIGSAIYSMYSYRGAPTETIRTDARIASEALGGIKQEIQSLHEGLMKIERELEGLGAPYTPGRTGQP